MSSTETAWRLAECPRWRPLVGMRLLSPDGWARVDDDRLTEWEGWPDLDDPATQGCLLMLLRQVRAHVKVEWSDVEDRAEVCAWSADWMTQDVGRSQSLGEALALALLAAWGSSGA